MNILLPLYSIFTPFWSIGATWQNFTPLPHLPIYIGRGNGVIAPGVVIGGLLILDNIVK